jgi:hypothetical protein
MNDELEEKIKKMNLDELKLYEKASVFAKRVVGFIGVSIMLFGLYFPMLPVIVGVGGLAYLLSNLSVSVHESLKVLREYITKLEKTR